MGFKNGMGSKIYLTIREGKIAHKQGDAYVLYDSFEGQIVGISTREGKYGTDLCLDLLDNDKVYQLQIKMKGEEPTSKQTSYFIAFAHCCPGIDPSKKVEFIPSLKIVEDKKRSALFIKQNGQILKWSFKVGQDGVPAPEELKNKKGEVISTDWSEVEAYRVDRVNEFTKKLIPFEPVHDIVADHAMNPYVESPQDDDDLPF
jgi:hypothetical protein